MSFELTAVLFAWLAIGLLGLALSGLLRQMHELRTSLMPRAVSIGPGQEEGPPPVVPELAPTKADVTIALFSDPDCASCSRLLPLFESLAAASNRAEFAILLAGAGSGVDGDHVRLMQGQAELFEKLRIPVTPFAVAVDASGVVSGGSPVGSEPLLESFVRSMTDGGNE
ncbi:MAG: hypothetical protein M3546_12505 [Actinomycetota bacterium]|nr:hypothetical protein [Actinomycetota bacterium]